MLVSGGVISQSYLKLEVGRSVMAQRCTEPGGSVGLVVFWKKAVSNKNSPRTTMLNHLFRGLRCNQFHISIILKLEALTSD